VYAPGQYSGYGARTLPGVREAIELERYEQGDGEIRRIAAAVDGLGALLDRIVAELEAVPAR
jgi:N-acetylated-alpha-linked acidic dipeptidase